MPKVHIMSNIYWAEPWLPKFLEQLDNLDYPKDRIQYGFSCSPANDNTIKILYKWLEDKDNYYVRMTRMNPQWHARRKMWTASNYNRRFAMIDSPEQDKVDYVFSSDNDVIYMPPNTLKHLVNLDVDIVHPYIYVEKTHQFYDSYGFRFLHGPFNYKMFPPVNHWADWYKANMNRNDVKADMTKRIIPMWTVGANPILIKREVIDNVWYDGLSNEAIVGFCNLAREAGYKLWSCPDIECIHSYDSIHSRPDA